MVSTFGGVLLRHPLTIAAAGHALHPVFVFKIPADGLADSSLEGFDRMPIQLAGNFPGVHGVAAVVAGTIFDESHEIFVRNDRIAWTQLIKEAAERLYNFQV